MIWEELDENLILLNIESSNSSDVLEFMGNKFINNGYCKDSFINALKEREEEYPTGINIDGLGVAMPHTNVNHVNKSTVGIGVLKKPIKFIHMGTDDEEVDVRVIFMLAVKDPNAHLEKIQTILTVIQDKNILEKIILAKNKEEIISLIKEKEMA